MEWNTPAKKLAADFFREVFTEHNLDAVNKYLHPDYIQHDYDVPPGREGFRKNFEKVFEIFPQFDVKIKHIIEDGDMIAIHGYGITAPGKIEVLVVDTYKMKDGLLYEHWGTVQALPPEQFGNPNIM